MTDKRLFVIEFNEFSFYQFNLAKYIPKVYTQFGFIKSQYMKGSLFGPMNKNKSLLAYFWI